MGKDQLQEFIELCDKLIQIGDDFGGHSSLKGGQHAQNSLKDAIK